MVLVNIILRRQLGAIDEGISMLLTIRLCIQMTAHSNWRKRIVAASKIGEEIAHLVYHDFGAKISSHAQRIDLVPLYRYVRERYDSCQSILNNGRG